MSTVKISQLAELTTAAADDLLLITDSDAVESKKIQKSNITQENFTTTLKNKLDGVEAGATADQTAQEIATAIDADATAETTLKSALGLGSAAYTASTDYATAAQGTNADTAYGWGDHASAGYADGTNESNWDTAYGWGDHSTVGYLTSYTETDPVVGAVTGIVKADGAGNISAASAGTDYLAPAAIGVTVQGYDADTVKYDDVNPSFTDTGAIKVPTGNTSQQPGSPVAGQFRFNSETGQFEGYNGTAWGAIAGGGGAGLQDTLMLMGA